ncbi:hypothetical protein EJ110_NYTH38060, partial [Nymphaea thermarum]
GSSSSVNVDEGDISRSSTLPGEAYASEEQPLWKEMKADTKDVGSGGGNVHFVCRFCEVTYVGGSYTKIKAHLSNLSGFGIRPCKSKLQDRAYAIHNKKKTSIIMINSKSSDKKRKTIETCFDSYGRAEIDKVVAKFFYSSCIPFNEARNPYWKKSQFGVLGRVTSNLDNELNTQRMSCMERLFSDSYTKRQAICEYNKFSLGDFSFEGAATAREDDGMSPFHRWASYGSEMPASHTQGTIPASSIKKVEAIHALKPSDIEFEEQDVSPLRVLLEGAISGVVQRPSRQRPWQPSPPSDTGRASQFVNDQVSASPSAGGLKPKQQRFRRK